MAACESTTWVSPNCQVRCELQKGHIKHRVPEYRTRHRYYVGGALDTEVTWEDPLPTRRKAPELPVVNGGRHETPDASDHSADTAGTSQS